MRMRHAGGFGTFRCACGSMLRVSGAGLRVLRETACNKVKLISPRASALSRVLCTMTHVGSGCTPHTSTLSPPPPTPPVWYNITVCYTTRPQSRTL